MYEASKHATTSLTQAIIHQQVDLPVNYTSEKMCVLMLVQEEYGLRDNKHFLTLGFSTLARRYQGQSFTQTYVTNKKEKKRMYNQRVLEVENGTFTPLVFNVYIWWHG